jgi:hypothetical protein
VLGKIVSGGQTGVDRGALDAALAAGFPCGGWCPAGRKAEDGPIPQSYPLVATASADYAERTRQNVLDSHGTLILHFGGPTGGTLKTLHLCEQHHKPYLAIDGAAMDPEQAGARAAAFVGERAIEVLNVAGPRESTHAGARAYAERAVAALIRRCTCASR